MTTEINSLEKGPQSVSIPAGDLLEWYSQQKAILDARSAELRRIFASTVGAETNPDVAFIVGRVAGEAALLRSFGDFLILNSTQQTV